MYGWRARIGLIIPANNTVIEPEIQNCLPDGVTVHSTRMLVEGPYDSEALIQMERNAARAIQELNVLEPDVQVYACMATSLVKGRDWNEAYIRRLDEAHSKSPMLTAASATMDALQTFGARRVAVFSPYPPPIHQFLRQFFDSYGLEITSNLNLEIDGYVEVTQQDPRQIYRRAREMNLEGADALCILSTDLPTLPIVEPLERDCGIPVVSTNQAVLWRALHTAHVACSVDGRGRLLREMPKPVEQVLA